MLYENTESHLLRMAGGHAVRRRWVKRSEEWTRAQASRLGVTPDDILTVIRWSVPVVLPDEIQNRMGRERFALLLERANVRAETAQPWKRSHGKAA